jgi:hypothetical protein
MCFELEQAGTSPAHEGLSVKPIKPPTINLRNDSKRDFLETAQAMRNVRRFYAAARPLRRRSFP